MVATPVLLQQALNTPLDPGKCAIAALGVLVIGLLPVHPPLRIGTGDAAWAGMLMLLGMDTQAAILLAIGLRLAILSLTILECGVGLLLLAFSGRGGPNTRVETHAGGDSKR